MRFGLHTCYELNAWGLGVGFTWQRRWQVGFVAMAGKWTVLFGWAVPEWSIER